MNIFMHVGIPVLVIFTIAFLALIFYKKVPSNKLMIKYGAFIKDGHSIIRGGGSVIIPLLQGCKWIDLGLMNTDIPIDGAYDSDKIKVKLVADATFKVSSNPDEQKIVAEALLSSKTGEIIKKVNDIILSKLRGVIATMTVEQLNADMEKFKMEVEKNIEKELSKIGLDLKNLNIKHIDDLSGILAARGEKVSSEIKNRARVDVAKENKIGRSESARLESETIEEEKKAQIVKEKAILRTEKEIEEAKAEKEKSVRIAQVTAQKESDLANEEAMQILKTQQIKTTKQEAELELERQRANEVVAKKIQNEKDILDNDAKLKIERDQATSNLEVAKAEADAIRLKAAAEADALKLQAAAQAELLALPKEREASAVKKLNEAMGSQTEKMTDFLLKQEYIKVLPQLVSAEADAVKAIGFKDITIIAGNGSDGSQALTNTVGDVLKSMPHMAFAMNMIKEINTGQQPELVHGEQLKPFEPSQGGVTQDNA